MHTNIIDAYTSFSIKSIKTYHSWILEYLYACKLNSNLENIVNKTIEAFVNEDITIHHNKRIVDINEQLFISRQTCVDKLLNKISFLLFKNTNDFDLTKANDEISSQYQILSNSILIAIELNKWANSIVNNCSFENTITRIVREHKTYFSDSELKNLNIKMPFLKREFLERQKVTNKIVSNYTECNIDYNIVRTSNYINDQDFYIIKPLYSFP